MLPFDAVMDVSQCHFTNSIKAGFLLLWKVIGDFPFLVFSSLPTVMADPYSAKLEVQDGHKQIERKENT